ncbi:unnamed protein product [Tetraodon nigroviridis]|uniref:(spotted green pufferfish) hypothetical protein n=1 Tax=Tetraodon nigroviridis TaxID=99883 RepID=Q4SYV3_TETNG|nr:unnamed protein product [Tetraodon nigroviridis]
MSCGRTAATPPKRPQAFQRAVQKLRCAGAVANLARGWQGWASQHSQKQDAVPSGWTPSSLDHCLRQEGQSAAKLAVTPRVVAADDGQAGSPIRACSITRMVQPKRSECGSLELVSAIRSKMEAAPEDSRTYLGSESPTRRRHMRALQEGGGGGVIQERKLMLQEKNLGSRSSSVDTEDSGLGEENGLSDNGEPKPEPEVTHTKKHTNRPKVRRRRRGR